MASPSIGSMIADFTLDSAAGRWRLKHAAGGAPVVYFHPRDNASDCTREGKAFRDHDALFRKARTAIVGVSPDSVASHRKFSDTHESPFPLLADPEQRACRLFDVIKEKSLYGRNYLGVERSTFLLEPKGVLRHEWRKVKVDGHAAEVRAAARAL